MQRELLFPTLLWSWQHPEASSLPMLAQRILDLETADPKGLDRTNQGSWHSRTTLLEDTGFEELFHWMAHTILDALRAMGWDLDQAKPCFNNAWAIVSREGEGVRAHLHPNSLFSGVFYLTAPENCGSIAFLDPRGGAQMLQFPQAIDGSSEHQQGRVLKEPKPGLLLLFPSWLWHEVEPSKSEHVRISISFNVGMRPV